MLKEQGVFINETSRYNQTNANVIKPQPLQEPSQSYQGSNVEVDTIEEPRTVPATTDWGGGFQRAMPFQGSGSLGPYPFCCKDLSLKQAGMFYILP